MSEADPGARYWRAIEPVWGTVSIYRGPTEFLRQFRQLPAPVGHLFAAHWLYSEVCNGGFHQFFSNPTGVLAPEAQAAFFALGLPEVAALVGRAMSFFGPVYSRDQAARAQVLESIPEGTRAQRDPFFSVDPLFYELLPSPQSTFERAADAYAERVGA
jgi:uncharacterized protein DUF4375